MSHGLYMHNRISIFGSVTNGPFEFSLSHLPHSVWGTRALPFGQLGEANAGKQTIERHWRTVTARHLVTLSTDLNLDG